VSTYRKELLELLMTLQSHLNDDEEVTIESDTTSLTDSRMKSLIVNVKKLSKERIDQLKLSE
jgi:coproporphyrinogen III oxidase-like Fe-S oxidoreductase